MNREEIVAMMALDTIGHTCGHNYIATAGLAPVVGAAEVIKQGKICGRIVAMGTGRGGRQRQDQDDPCRGL
jgi:metal-dependent amidase/aminoacylase/carboxypeptidase family protein